MTDSVQSKLIISSASAEAELSDEVSDELDTGAAFELRQVVVPAGSHAERLDRTLALAVPEFSRSYLQQLIEAGAVQLNGMVFSKSSGRVKAGNTLQIELRPTPQSQAFKPESMALEIVFQDEHLLVVNKPAGLVVHPAPGNWSGTLLNGLLGRDPEAGLLPRAGIVHRLDKDTSGLMVVARKRQVMEQLVGMIAARTVSREYLALAHGDWLGPAARQVEAPIGRDPRNRLRMAVVDLERHSGKSASTGIFRLASAGGFCLVRCKLQTGRTHQIRVHMASIGHPLVADEVYGGRTAADLTRQALHACRLAFEHPVTHAPLEFLSPLPPDLAAAVAGVGVGLGYNQDQ
ncbi:MAG: RluA family pseudouridine synthase [Pseudomonadota bacterium]|uniref:RluA family pseudouridine synthase n=1 Tax=Polaromonas sp. TaxID=1869339 RepID=UPI0017A0E966|nr:RluA family pseudouridine synthase [Polaromonas sp.]MBA3595020.1 RluA family pseudouridine synthase [Polaromonas sp.]MDQ3271071.1 RluA family pseudouridine synthase [Pseudomonadota bacterium]